MYSVCHILAVKKKKKVQTPSRGTSDFFLIDMICVKDHLTLLWMLNRSCLFHSTLGVARGPCGVLQMSEQEEYCGSYDCNTNYSTYYCSYNNAHGKSIFGEREREKKEGLFSSGTTEANFLHTYYINA